MGTLTPMMDQYRAIKKQYPDCLLFFRLGDFYELFGTDAEKAAKELQIVLTSREIGKNQRTPMCGVPYHAADSYLKRLLDSGYKVAICEQLEEPKPGKNLVKRDVVRVLTPGTVLNPIFLDQEKNNYILSLHLRKDTIGCAWCDVSTGEFMMAQFTGPSYEDYLIDLMNRLQPVECIIRSEQIPFLKTSITGYWQEQGVHVTHLKNTINRDKAVNSVYEQFDHSDLVGIDRQALEEGLVAVAYLLSYIESTQKTSELPFRSLSVFTPHSRMYLDTMTRRNLEIFATLRDGKKEGSLLWALDHTYTPMGARMLRNWLEFPLLDVGEIQERQSGTEELVNNFFLRNELKECLKDIYDLERIIGRVEWQVAHPRDLLALAKSLEVIPRIKQALNEAGSSYLQKLNKELDPAENTRDLIKQAVADNPPVNIKEWGIIKNNYHPEVDRLRSIINQGSTWIKELEAAERLRTGIKSLKIGFNKVFGYYIEVTKPNLSLVPSDYVRKQTLTQAERFITPELKEREEAFLGATERLQDLEYNLFIEIRRKVGLDSQTIRRNAVVLAQLDCLLSFAETSLRYNYVKPVVNETGIIKIKNGRHPVLEQIIGEGSFIPNDLCIGQEDNRIHLLTGPNMAGKSTFMRQMALLVLMAQCGSFVPAEEAEIGIVDRIFVRAGAMDDLGKGQSTFMMEMSEVSYILQHATKNSFIILDEIGRGTGTFDGLGIAWAIVEYIHDRIGARVLFATHYHQLTQLADKLSGVVNYSIAVAEKGDEIIFLRKVIPGGTDKSYGIQVARLAKLPEALVNRAREIADSMEGEFPKRDIRIKNKTVQLVLFDEEDQILRELQGLNLINITPLEALNTLSNWQQMLHKRTEGKNITKKRR